MKKMKMCFPREKTFVDGFAEYILDCKARNLREGTINHYRESVKQIYKRIPPDTPISSLNQQTINCISNGEKSSLLPIIFIHIRASLNEIPHFINCGGW